MRLPDFLSFAVFVREHDIRGIARPAPENAVLAVGTVEYALYHRGVDAQFESVRAMPGNVVDDTGNGFRAVKRRSTVREYLYALNRYLGIRGVGVAEEQPMAVHQFHGCARPESPQIAETERTRLAGANPALGSHEDQDVAQADRARLLDLRIGNDLDGGRQVEVVAPDEGAREDDLFNLRLAGFRRGAGHRDRQRESQDRARENGLTTGPGNSRSGSMENDRFAFPWRELLIGCAAVLQWHGLELVSYSPSLLHFSAFHALAPVSPHRLRKPAMALKQPRNARGVGPPPATLRRNSEFGQVLPCGIHAGRISCFVAVVNETQVEINVAVNIKILQGEEVTVVGTITRHRNMQEIDLSRDRGIYAVHHFDEYSHIRRHHQVFIGWRPVTQVITEFDILGYRIAEPAKQIEYLFPVIGSAVRKVLLKDQDFLADVKLNREILMRDPVQDSLQCGAQGPLIYTDEIPVDLVAHVHAGSGHRGGQADLEPYAFRDASITAHGPEDAIGVQSRPVIARIEANAREARSIPEAKKRHGAQQSAVPLADLQIPHRGIDFDVRVLHQHLTLEKDPA